MRGPGQAVRFLAVLAGVLAFVACGGDEELPTSRIVTPASEESPASTPTEPALETPSPTPPSDEDEDATEEPDETPEPGDDEANDAEETDESPATGSLDAVMSAASEALGVPADGDCSAGEDCIRPLPGGSSDPGGDITRLAYESASGGGAIIVMAKDGSGAWGVWMLTQNPYQLLDLPGELRACARPVVVHESPASDAPAIGEVSRGESLSAGGVTLTQPGSLSAAGSAWYNVSSPIQGWVPSEDVTAAANGDCSHRDAAEGEPNPRG